MSLKIGRRTSLILLKSPNIKSECSHVGDDVLSRRFLNHGNLFRWCRVFWGFWVCAACVGASCAEECEDEDCGSYDDGFVGLHKNSTVLRIFKDCCLQV